MGANFQAYNFQVDSFDFFGPNFPKNGFWSRNFENLSSDSQTPPPKYHMCQFSGKTDNFEFFGQNFPKNGICRRNFKNLSLDFESPPPRYHVCQFSGKIDNLEFFGVNLGKLPNYMQYFGSYNVEGVPESWVEAEISSVEEGGRM